MSMKDTGVIETVTGRGNAAIDRLNAVQDRIVNEFFEKWAVNFTYFAFAFVFFYFGLQKPAPVDSPVRTPVSES